MVDVDTRREEWHEEKEEIAETETPGGEGAQRLAIFENMEFVKTEAPARQDVYGRQSRRKIRLFPAKVELSACSMSVFTPYVPEFWSVTQFIGKDQNSGRRSALLRDAK
jgi:hypothetical protein